MLKFLHWFGNVLVGSGVISYRSRQDWLTRCVVVRLGSSLVFAALAITLAFAFGNAFAEYGLSSTLMAHSLIALTLAFTLLLAFGSGRNYGRLETQAAQRHAEPVPRWSFPQHPPAEMGNDAILEELVALNPRFVEDDYRWNRWRSLITVLATRADMRVWIEKKQEGRG